MIYRRYWSLLVLGFGCLIARGQEKPLPFETFAGSDNAIQQMSLSPNGDKVAYLAGNKAYDSTMIYVLDLKTGKASGVEAPLRMGFDSVSWISADRLLGSYFGGYVAVNADGKNYTSVHSNGRRIGSVMYVFPRKDKRHQQVLFQNDYFPSEKMDADDHGYSRPDLLAINIQTGSYKTVCTNPGDVVGWFTDRNGDIRMRLELRNGKLALIYRDKPDAEWTAVPGLEFAVHQKWVMGFNNEGDHALIEEDKSSDESALRLYNLKTGTMDAEILAVKHGSFLQPVWAPDHRLLGVRFMDSRRRMFWFDETYGRIQQAMESRLPGQFVNFVNSSDDESKLLFFANSSQNRGTYYLLDVKEGSLAKLVDVDPTVPVAHLSKEISINLKARDGLTLPGFLTLPAGRPAKNLPLIVWAHSGPWQRNHLGYHSAVQFLANHGYAILIVDYRGSSGYTDAYYRAGFGQLGSGILTDLEDATTAALKSGMFDPKRVAVMGWGFGGYCAYMCGIRRPDLFACGLAVNAIVDWEERIATADPLNPDYYGFDEEHLGFSKADTAALARMTPLQLVDQIKIPFLVAYDDLGNPNRSGDKKMAQAMKKAGCDVEIVDGYSEASFYTRKGGAKLYSKAIDFLAARLK